MLGNNAGPATFLFPRIDFWEGQAWVPATGTPCKPTVMDDNHNSDVKGSPSGEPGKGNNPMSKPQWADSLRNLYDSVVEEPIPDSFKDLLAQFDEPKQATGKSGGTE